MKTYPIPEELLKQLIAYLRRVAPMEIAEEPVAVLRNFMAACDRGESKPEGEPSND